MRHLRRDYDTIQPWPLKRPHIVKRIDGQHGTPMIEGFLTNTEAPIIADDEPVFVLRGQDPAAGLAVIAWADFAEHMGADQGLCQQVRAWGREMMTYAGLVKHGPPDVPAEMLREA